MVHLTTTRRVAAAVLATVATMLVTALAGAPAAHAGTAPVAAEDGHRSYRNASSDKCLAVADPTMTNGSKVVQLTCNGLDDQHWRVTDNEREDYYEFRNKANPQKCLAVPDESTTAGTQLVIQDCNGHDAQLWGAWDATDGGYGLQNFHSSLYVGVVGASTENGAAVIQTDWLNHPDQRWH